MIPSGATSPGSTSSAATSPSSRRCKVPAGTRGGSPPHQPAQRRAFTCARLSRELERVRQNAEPWAPLFLDLDGFRGSTTGWDTTSAMPCCPRCWVPRCAGDMVAPGPAAVHHHTARPAPAELELPALCERLLGHGGS